MKKQLSIDRLIDKFLKLVSFVEKRFRLPENLLVSKDGMMRLPFLIWKWNSGMPSKNSLRATMPLGQLKGKSEWSKMGRVWRKKKKEEEKKKEKKKKWRDICWDLDGTLNPIHSLPEVSRTDCFLGGFEVHKDLWTAPRPWNLWLLAIWRIWTPMGSPCRASQPT